MNPKANKMNKLPKHWSYQRELLNELLLKSADYKNSLIKGLPFFTTKELSAFEKKYKAGITWNEIDSELSKKGMIFKKSTFRKYIQDRKIPQATKYKKTEKGREALYPSSTISHINFLQYFYRIADNEIIDKLLDSMAEETINAKEAIEGNLESGNLYVAIFHYLRGISFPNDDIEDAINEILQDDTEFRDLVFNKLNKLDEAFNRHLNEIDKLLSEYEIPITKIS
ncbi:MAG: hypothetical protein KQI78_10825 [Deltaproteobacteria bacterium]|nr:hypothetical protein [Deltaproteobacteria bacterium]